MYELSHKNWLIVIVLAFLFWAQGWCGEELPEIQQVTTHPGLDFSPSISPDGKWLAFVSERSGNLDVWIKRLPHGTARQITTHQSEDVEPVWSPDGKKLAFVSKRRDAQGDVWIVNLRLKSRAEARGKPYQLTQYLGSDRAPSFSPDGRRIVFVSGRGGRQNLWIIEVDTKRTYPLTTGGGTNPVWSARDEWILFNSLRQDPAGDLYLIRVFDTHHSNTEEPIVRQMTQGPASDGQGTWSPDGNTIVFQRIHRDTNGDGLINFHDRGSLWQKNVFRVETEEDEIVLDEGIELQLTTEMYEDATPYWSQTGEILFASTRGGGWDVWSIPEEGLMPQHASAFEQYAAVLERFGESVTAEALSQAILGYQRVVDFFPTDSLWCARSLIHIGEMKQSLKDDEGARETFQKVRDDYSGIQEEAARAALKLALLPGGVLDERIELCRNIVSTSSRTTSTVAEAWLVMGQLYGQKDDSGQELVAYTRVLDFAPRFWNLRAEAQLRIGDILSREGQTETARQTYLSVLREFKDVPLWRKRAGERILDQVQGTLSERIRGYQRIVQEATDLPDLMAESQLSIGRALMGENLNAQAVRELERVEKMVPELSWAHAEAKILQSETYASMGDALKGILLLEEVIDVFGSLEGGRFKIRAQENLFRLMLESADVANRFGDFALAESRYRKALEIQPDDIRVHHGLVEAVNGRGRIEALVGEYEEKVNESPDDPVLLYALGLAVSYYAERDIELLKRSNAYLARALVEDYRLIHPYRTLSFNYELIEQIEERQAQRESGWAVKVGRTLFAPIRWLIGLLPFGGDGKREQYYEKAIEALTTALELNDEDDDPQMEALLAQNLANNFYHLGEYGFRKAYQYYQSRLSLDSSFVSPLQKAVFFERAGRCGVFLVDLSASEYLQTAVDIYTDLDREGDALRNLRLMAFLYHLNEHYEEAISVYQRTIEIAKKRRNWTGVERDYRNMAYNYFLMGESEDALKYAHEAERLLLCDPISIKPSRKGYLRIEVFGFSIPVWGMEEIGGASAEGFTPADELAFVYGLLSRSYEKKKSFRQALSYEEKRRDIFVKRKDNLAERISLNRLGRLHYKMSNFSHAWEHFHQSWKKSKKRKDDRGRWVAVVNLGNTAIVEVVQLGERRRFEETKRCLEVELGRTDAEEDGQREMERLILLNTLGSLLTTETGSTDEGEDIAFAVKRTLLNMEQLSRGTACLEEGLQLARQGGFRREEGVLLKNMGEAVGRIGDTREAIAYLKQALHVFEESGEEDLVWRVLYGMGKLAGHLSEDDSSETARALEYYREAMDRLERLPGKEEGSEERLSDRNERRLLYTDAAFEMARLGLIEEALRTAERGKRKWVSDLMTQRPPELKRERHKVAWGNLRFLRSRLYDLDREMSLLGEKKEERLRRKELTGMSQRYEAEYQEVMKTLREEDRVLAYLSGAEEVTLEEWQSALPAGGGALCYLEGSRGMMLWAIDRDTVFSKWMAVNPLDIQTKVDLLRRRIHADSAYQETGQELHNFLMGPVHAFVENKTSLLIVPDGCLWQCPFPALWDGRAFLSEKAALMFSPSLSAYRLAWERRKINYQEVFFVGDKKTYEYADALADADITATFLTGSEATEERFVQQYASSDVLHLDRRFVSVERDPFTSAVAFLPGGAYDGFLRVQELFSQNLRASLVILPPTRGYPAPSRHSVMAFFYGLLYAGAPSMVEPMWEVEADAKSVFFGTFYEHLGKFSVSTAMTLARDAGRDRFHAPRFWAAFRLWGYEGMDAQGREHFARENLYSTVMKGRAYERRGEFRDAVEEFEQALDMAASMEDSSLTVRIYDEIRRASVKGGFWQRAAEAQQHIQAAAEMSGDRDGVRMSLDRLVAYYAQNQQYDKAAESRLAFIRLMEEEGSSEELIQAYEELAFIFAEAREYEEALRWARKAAALYEERGDDSGKARALLLTGRFLLDSDDYWKARRFLSEGVALLEEERASPRWDENAKANLASGYQLLGLAEERLSRYRDAVVHQQNALALFQELQRQASIAQGYQYLANLYWATGDYRQALSHQQKALNSFEALGDAKLLAMAYSTQGLIQMALGDLEKAKASELKALELAEEKALLADQATILKNIGLVAVQEQDLQRAQDAFQRATRIDSSLGFQRGLAYDYRNLGSVMAHSQRWDDATRYLGRALSLSEEIGDKKNVAECYYRLGRVYAGMGDRQEALAVLDSADALTARLFIPELRWRVLRQRANVLKEIRRDEEAQGDFREAIDIVETLRAELKVEAYMQGFIDSKMDLYSDAVGHLVRMKRTQEALDFVERAKSRGFIDLLQNQDLRLVPAQEEALNREREAKQAIREAQERLGWYQQREHRLSSAERREMETWAAELVKRRDAYEALVISMQAENPELASFVSVDPLTVDEIQSLLPDSSALLEYFLAHDKLFCWMVKRNGINVETVSVEEANFRELVTRFRETLQAHLSADVEADELYRTLIRPVENHLSGVKHLVIVPHGVLHYLPFSALINDDEAYLVDRFSLSVVPSATVLAHCMEKGDLRRQPEAPPRVLALSNPSLDDEAYHLPFAEKEVQSLQRTYGEVSAYYGVEATERLVREKAASYDLIHFACHGIYEPDHPLFSTLLLTPDGGDDGRLEAHEIFGLHLDCDLVTLSACETGLARITQGDEIIGLSRSFIFAGTPSLITGLWKVDDLATAVLMKRFYRYLESGQTKAEALRRAQLLVKEAVNNHPSAWAAFQLTGDFQ